MVERPYPARRLTRQDPLVGRLSRLCLSRSMGSMGPTFMVIFTSSAVIVNQVTTVSLSCLSIYNR